MNFDRILDYIITYLTKKTVGIFPNYSHHILKKSIEIPEGWEIQYTLSSGAELTVVPGIAPAHQKKLKTCIKYIGIRTKLFISLKLDENYCIIF